VDTAPGQARGNGVNASGGRGTKSWSRAPGRPPPARPLARALTAAEAADTVIKTVIQPGGLTRPRATGCGQSVRPVLSREMRDGAPGG
jgi:hypothetical protein